MSSKPGAPKRPPGTPAKDNDRVLAFPSDRVSVPPPPSFVYPRANALRSESSEPAQPIASPRLKKKAAAQPMHRELLWSMLAVVALLAFNIGLYFLLANQPHRQDEGLELFNVPAVESPSTTNSEQAPGYSAPFSE